MISVADQIQRILEHKEILFRGWIAYAALCDVNSVGLSTEYLYYTFGEWLARPLHFEYRDDRWFLTDGPAK